MSHTEGLLAANLDHIESKEEHGWINDGWIIAQCQGPDAVANARHLAACWNACDGLPKDALDGGWTAAGISQHAKRLEEENAALKAENERFRKGETEQAAVNALRPFAEIGAWLFARDLPDETPVVEINAINGVTCNLTRGHFKAAHTAYSFLSTDTEEE